MDNEENKMISENNAQAEEKNESAIQEENTKQALQEEAMRLHNIRESLENEQRAVKKDREDLTRERLEFEKFREDEKAALRKKLDDIWRIQSARQSLELEESHEKRMTAIREEEKRASDASIKRMAELREQNEKSLRDEFDTKRACLQAKIDAEEAEHKDNMAKESARLHATEQDLATREASLQEKSQQLLKDRASLDSLKRQMDIFQHSMEEERRNLSQTAQALAEDKIQAERSLYLSNKEALERANAENRSLQERINYFETLSNRLGGREPEDILHEMEDKKLSIEKLRQELSTRPSRELKIHYDELEIRERNAQEKVRNLQNLIDGMQADLESLATARMELTRERQEKELWKQQFEAMDAVNAKLEEDFRRLKSQYGKGEELEERIKAVETPYIIDPSPLMTVGEKDEIPEMAWLDNIEKRCAEYGFKFPRRILNAFHTSLKVSEWSPVTVLAGVSGTGKSELPRLYSLFGGINFMLLPVQPNWDSQESMLGFFNTIDNVFDAQPVLRFLAQSRKEKTDEYPGLVDTLNLILLDEMNLAHIELYFAEFLSKLELRRGRSKRDLPNLEVKLGADINKPYLISLGRNILFAGTMNQDETTKSLSDKVLDRSGVIHFPRPITLNRRSISKPLPKKPDFLLPYNVWRNQWVIYENNFSDEDILPYKRFVQDINRALENVGRALGHRVWQSIEAYMANYPDVLAARKENAGHDAVKAAMRMSFEDQLVQKIMPKLRGIETRSSAGNKCLGTIAKMLADENYGIGEDFQIAREAGYGQFMWSSARYLDAEGHEENLAQETMAQETAN